MNLYSLLTTSRGQKASDARDKVYAFLGLAKLEEQIKVNYSLSTYEAFKMAAQMLVSRSDLRFLYAVESKNRETSFSSGLPSWVPDWTKEQDMVSHIKEIRSKDFDARRGASKAPKFFPYTSQNTLCLHGVYVAVVTQEYNPTLKSGDNTHHQVKLMK